jgi:ABC-type sugar transport system ATPase subunit
MNLIPAAEAPQLLPPDVASSGLTLGIRPHDLELTPPEVGVLRGRIDVVEPLGHARIVHVGAGTTMRLTAVVSADTVVSPGDAVGLSPRSGRLHLYDAAGARLADPRFH